MMCKGGGFNELDVLFCVFFKIELYSKSFIVKFCRFLSLLNILSMFIVYCFVCVLK